MKLISAMGALVLMAACLALAVQATQPELSPAGLVSSLASASDAAIIYDGESPSLIEEAASTEGADELEQASEEEDAALIEIEKAAGGAKAAKKASPAAGAKAPKAKKTRSAKAPKVARNKRKGGNKRAAAAGAKHGWGIAPRARRRVQQRLPAARLTGAAATLTRANVRCVLCQFIMQKLKNDLTGAADSTAAPAASASLIEAFSFASVGEQSRIESTVSAAAYADASSSAVPALFDHGSDSPRRFRHTDVLASRAGRARFTQVRTGLPGAETEAARSAYLKLYATVYASFEGLCAKRMPLAYLPYCNDMLKSYRFFAQGINYGDRAEQICMNGNFCDSRAYVRRVTHNAYSREPGDA